MQDEARHTVARRLFQAKEENSWAEKGKFQELKADLRVESNNQGGKCTRPLVEVSSGPITLSLLGQET